MERRRGRFRRISAIGSGRSCATCRENAVRVGSNVESGRVPPGCVDVCTMVFVLSAIAPERMPDVLRNVSSVMRPGGAGRVLLRDYADGDLSPPASFASQGRRTKVGGQSYVLGDGRRAFYFEKRFVKASSRRKGWRSSATVHARATRTLPRCGAWIGGGFSVRSPPRTAARRRSAPPPPPEPEWRRRARRGGGSRRRGRRRSEAGEGGGEEARARHGG